MANDIPLTSSELWVVLDYDPDTGELRWKPRGVDTRTGRAWDTRYAGAIAGRKLVFECGRPWKVRLTLRVEGKDRYFAAHRLVWKMMTGDAPPDLIDHENGDPWDNRWGNLRDGGSGVNSSNCALRSDNTTGACGVRWRRDTQKWQVYVKRDGRQRSAGCFSEEDYDLAVMEAMEARAELGYSKRHGKSA